MLKALVLAAFVAAIACVPARAQEDKAKEWCTDAHMQQMEDDIAKMTDAAKQKEAKCIPPSTTSAGHFRNGMACHPMMS